MMKRRGFLAIFVTTLAGIRRAMGGGLTTQVVRESVDALGKPCRLGVCEKNGDVWDFQGIEGTRAYLAYQQGAWRIITISCEPADVIELKPHSAVILPPTYKIG